VAIGILAFHKQVAVILTELIAEYNFANIEGKGDLGGRTIWGIFLSDSPDDSPWAK
jgi:hypothetical protein